jgi:aspartyl-tRNA(Asn)/glutamyl-tRNA(Gln) amidotransferase subunit A
MQNSTQKHDVAFLTISELSELIRTGKISPVEVTRLMLERIDALNPALQAYITVTRDIAMKEAQTAEAEIRQKRWRGPLHGVPLALKDLFDTEGVVTTAGSAVFKNRVPQADAEVVRRLKAAGAVLLGKTSMHEFAYGGSSLVTCFGGVHNPWDPDRIAGGSSGGSAAAVAAGLCYGALGSDTAGSIRNPAAYCGIVGHKPTYGLVSNRGVIPLSWTLDHVGPMTRTVTDSALILQAIAGYDPEDITSVRLDLPDYASALRMPTNGLRVGVARDFFFERLDKDIETAVESALRVLETLTAYIIEVEIPARSQEEVRAIVRAVEAYTYHADMLANTPELYQPETLARLRAGADVGTVDYIHGRQQIERTRRKIGAIFRAVDVVVTPTCGVGPPLISEFSGNRNGSADFNTRNIQNSSPFNVYGWPAISVPCGFTPSGMPVGLQIAGALGADATVLQVAHAYEQATENICRRGLRPRGVR